MSKNQNKIILGIVHTSLGELQWIVPYFFLLEKRKEGYEFALLFFSNETLLKAEQESFHLNEFRKFGTVVKKKELFFFLIRERRNIHFIFKDFWPIYKTSLASAIRFVCHKATLLLYPHANAIYSLANTPYPLSPSSIKHDERCFDYLLLNTNHDLGYWSKRIQPDKTIITGAPAYEAEWLEKVEKNQSAEVEIVLKKAAGRRIVPVFTRPGDNQFLKEEDYEFLIKSLISELVLLEDVYLVFKPHPRENRTLLSEKLENLNFENYCITGLNVFSLCSHAYFSVHFWSSTITDSLAVGCPSIEYFRYQKEGNDKWLEQATGKYVSFYDYLGLCIAAEDQKGLKKSIENILANREEILAQQRTMFEKVFFNSSKLGLSHDLRTSQLRGHSVIGSLNCWFKILASTVKSTLIK